MCKEEELRTVLAGARRNFVVQNFNCPGLQDNILFDLSRGKADPCKFYGKDKNCILVKGIKVYEMELGPRSSLYVIFWYHFHFGCIE